MQRGELILAKSCLVQTRAAKDKHNYSQHIKGSRSHAMLNVLGLQRTNFGSREIDLLFTNPSISQDHLLTQELTVQMAQSYGLLPEQAQEGDSQLRCALSDPMANEH